MVLWQPGQQIQNRLQLLERLGTGGNRQTWLCKDLKIGKPLVLKALYFDPDDKFWQNQRLLEREAQTLQNIHHPAVARPLDNFWLEALEGQYFCLLIEYIPGESLSSIIQREGRLRM